MDEKIPHSSSEPNPTVQTPTQNNLDLASNPTNSEPQLSKNPFNLIKKPIGIQYLILILWIVASLIAVYYLTYESLFLDLIHNGILPVHQPNLIYIALGIGGAGWLLLLLTPNKL